MSPLVTPRGTLVAPTSLTEPTSEGVYLLTLRLDAASAKSLPEIDGYGSSWSEDCSNADFTFKTHGYGWTLNRLGERQRLEPPPVFDVRARLYRSVPVLGSVVRISFFPRGFALHNSPEYFGFAPVNALHLSAVQVLTNA